MQKKTLNIGIVAHVDAGKTSITEQLLFQSGASNKLGNVDKGTCISDNLELEKQRGISIQNTCVTYTWKNTRINIIDTPGHVDFSSEVDRAISVLDGVILVISAIEGIQAHTLSLWENIKELDIPILIFINKIDRDGVDEEHLINDIENELCTKCFCINTPSDNNTITSYIDSTEEIKLIDKSYENLADLDSNILEMYLDSTLNNNPLVEKIVEDKILNKEITGVHFGIAKRGVGIVELNESIIKFSSRNNLNTEKNNARIFKIEHHHKHGLLAHIRLYSGVLKAKDLIFCKRINKEIKINQLLENKIGKLEVLSTLSKNNIGIIAISEPLISGDILGLELEANSNITLSKPVLSVEVEAIDDTKYQNLAHSLQILNSEDPSLDFVWDKEEKTFSLKIMGPMQSEIISHALKTKFDLDVNINPPRILYKETILETAEATVRYTMPKPCWAVLSFRIEAGKANSGIEYKSMVGVNDISRKYQNEIERAIPWALEQGLKGWPVSDLIITLLAGEDHVMHSNPGDFLLATPMGIMNTIKNGDTQLLEPYYNYEIKANQEHLGAITSDLNNMKAEIGQAIFDANMFFLKGKVAVSKALNYSIKFQSTCSGKGRLKLQTGEYYPCKTSEDKIREYKGINPLDRSQWILHNRGALKADDRLY